MNPILKAQIEKDIQNLEALANKSQATEQARLEGKIEGLKLALDRFKVAHEVLAPTEYQNAVTGVTALKMGAGYWALRSICGPAFFWNFKTKEWVIHTLMAKDSDPFIRNEETALQALDTVQPYRP